MEKGNNTINFNYKGTLGPTVYFSYWKEQMFSSRMQITCNSPDFTLLQFWFR